MRHQQCDILILGSGIGGSLLAAVLAKAGRDVVLLDRIAHPRFAIGESSTPLADSTLLNIAQRFSLPDLLPLTSYGAWKRHAPELTCGLKRGFSYFGHDPDRRFDPQKQLLAAASLSDEFSDTHWLRSDVDEFVYQLAKKSGATAVVSSDYALEDQPQQWSVYGTANDRNFKITSPFIVDASGSAAVVPRCRKVPHVANAFEFNPSTTYAHFGNLPTVQSIFAENNVDISHHPFSCDAAAVHHVLQNGWMWQLRFDDDTVSAGLMTLSDPPAGRSMATWQSMFDQYPLLQRQFLDAEIVRPGGALVTARQVRRLFSKAAGDDWAALPGTVGFVDPLHSTGIAHTLSGVIRLAETLLQKDSTRSSSLSHYSRQVVDELQHVGRLVDGCYAALPSFRLWSDWCMLYFAAATSGERQQTNSFLLADDPAFRETLTEARRQLQMAVNTGEHGRGEDQFRSWLKSAIAPWNNVGLMDDSAEGMYATTAAPQRQP